MNKQELIRRNINGHAGPLFYFSVDKFIEKNKPNDGYFRLVTIPANNTEVKSFKPKEIEKFPRRYRKAFLVLDGQTVREPNDYEKKTIRKELREFNKFYLAE